MERAYRREHNVVVSGGEFMARSGTVGIRGDRVALLGAAARPRPTGPAAGTPAVVTLGDSAISGEAGRWAGNTNADSWRARCARLDGLLGHGDRRVDPRLPSLEGRAGVHRRRRARLQPRLLGRARRRRAAPPTGEDFKPGIDFYSDAQGREGQARALQQLAATRNVKAVVVMIGANNYGFAAIVSAA